jgi:hypothetical protein
VIEADVFAQLTVVAILAVGAAVFIFGWDRRGAVSFHLAPHTSAEWVAFWFHTLEFISACALFAMLHPAARHLPGWGAPILYYALFGSPGLLALSALGFWRFDSSLCRHAVVLLVLFGFGLLLFPAVG